METEQQARAPINQHQKSLVRILLVSIVLLVIALIVVTGYFATREKSLEKKSMSNQQPVPTEKMSPSNQMQMEQGRIMREDLNSVLSFDPLLGWRIQNYAEDQVIHITSPDYVKDDFNPQDSYEMIPKKGVLITMKVHDRIDMHFNLQELREWMKTQGKWDKITEMQLGGIPSFYMVGKYKYPDVEDYSLPVQDDWYMSDEVNNTHFFDVRITYAGSSTEASVLKTKYQSQIDQFLKSIQFQVYTP